MDVDVLEKYKRAGVIASACLRLGESLIKPGADMLVVIEEIEAFIFKEGAFPAFPPQISLNDVAAHFYPEESYIFKVGDLAKLDVGVSVDGYIADNAVTVDLGDNSALVSASRDALNEALKLVRPGVRVSVIGSKIQEVISGRGFTPVINLSGHGLGRFEVHCSPSIPNIGVDSDVVLEEGMVIAIEPFASAGAGVVYESGRASLFSLVSVKPLRRPDSRLVLKEILKYNGLPFSSTALFKIFGRAKVLFALREMKQLGMLREHPPLVDKHHGLVSQAEHSVIVFDEPIVYTRFDLWGGFNE